MAFNYAQLESTAQKLLQNFGQQLTFTRTAQGSIRSGHRADQHDRIDIPEVRMRF